jgi:lysophospholipase L1-like esterase
MKRLKALSINLAVAATSLLVCLLLVEVVLRFSGFGNLEIYAADPHVYWRLKANQDCFTKVDHQPVHINAKSTRGPDFEIPKPPGVIRILSIGDSSTFGWGLSDEQTYSRILEKNLNGFLQASASARSVIPINPTGARSDGPGPTHRVEVINAGCNAWGYPQLKSFFTHYGIAMQPDYVLIAGANLWTDFTEEASPEFKQAMARRVFLKNTVRRSALYHFLFEREMSGLYNKIRTRFIPVDPNRDKILGTSAADPMQFFEKHLRELILIAQTNKIQPVLLTIPPDRTVYTNETSDTVITMRRRLATELKVPNVDLTTGDWPAPGKSVYLEGDFVHLNPDGNQQVAEKLTQCFAKLL